MGKKGLIIKGIYRDILKDKNNQVIYDSGWVKNAIVDNCRKLLAAFMKNEFPGATFGIRYLQVGKGLEQWDTEGIPPIDIATTYELITPYVEEISVGDLIIKYLDENNNELPAGADPTSRLQITVTLQPGYPDPEEPLDSYPLREFGLFGEYKGLPYMIDAVRHPVIHKDKESTLIRVIRLYF